MQQHMTTYSLPSPQRERHAGVRFPEHPLDAYPILPVTPSQHCLPLEHHLKTELIWVLICCVYIVHTHCLPVTAANMVLAVTKVTTASPFTLDS